MDRQALKDCLVTAIQVSKEVQAETGCPINAEDVVKLSIAAFIQMSRNGGNGNGHQPARPLVISFGKHKGRTLEELAKVDRSYLNWLAQKSEIEKIRIAAKQVLEANPVVTAKVTIPKPVQK